MVLGVAVIGLLLLGLSMAGLLGVCMVRQLVIGGLVNIAVAGLLLGVSVFGTRPVFRTRPTVLTSTLRPLLPRSPWPQPQGTTT